jgi:hypothetical protein
MSVEQNERSLRVGESQTRSNGGLSKERWTNWERMKTNMDFVTIASQDALESYQEKMVADQEQNNDEIKASQEKTGCVV